MEVKNILKREDAKNLLKNNIVDGKLSIPPNFSIIDIGAFEDFEKSDCSTKKLVDLFVPKTVMVIGMRAFQNASFIRKLHFEERDATIEIKENAFKGNWLKTVEFPLKVMVGEGAFSNSRVKSVFVKNGEKRVKTLKRKATIIIIKERAFNECVELSNLYFSDKAKAKIGSKAFEYAGIEEVTINCEVDLGIQAFANCTNLKRVNLKGCSKVMYEAFYSCFNLQSVVFEMEKEKSVELSNRAFAECVNLCKVDFENCWLSEVRDGCFFDCEKLRYIDLSKTTYIHNGAFSKCKLLGKINCSYVRNIGDYAFSECCNLHEVELGGKVLGIGKFAFIYTNISSIIFPKSLTKIGEGAFKYCGSLEEVKFPEHIKEIEPNSFEACKYLERITFHRNTELKVIGANSFKDCENVTQIRFPKLLEKIGTRAFYNCTNLRTINFKEECVQLCIGDFAFANCENLEDFVFPNFTQNIGDFAFENCFKLGSIIFRGNWPATFGANVFKGCNINSINFNVKK